MRLYPFGRAPQDETRPYATWQTISGLPENHLGDRPDTDSYTLQLDVWATTETGARDAANAIRDAVEPVAHITSWRGEQWDDTTELRRYSFDVEWIVFRTAPSEFSSEFSQEFN
jgi:hypothetical protein